VSVGEVESGHLGFMRWVHLGFMGWVTRVLRVGSRSTRITRARRWA
jgi:hypothetical protein